MDVGKLICLLGSEWAMGGFEIGRVGKELVRHWRFRCLEIARGCRVASPSAVVMPQAMRGVLWAMPIRPSGPRRMMPPWPPRRE